MQVTMPGSVTPALWMLVLLALLVPFSRLLPPSRLVLHAWFTYTLLSQCLCCLQDPDLHVKHLKPSPAASSIVNRCIECGFCESNCPSRDITLTPRQRITTYREISRLRDIGDRTDAQQKRLGDFEKSYDYDGDATCAADGMCQVKCPVKINTGELIKQLRSDELEGGDHPRATKGAMVSSVTLPICCCLAAGLVWHPCVVRPVC